HLRPDVGVSIRAAQSANHARPAGTVPARKLGHRHQEGKRHPARAGQRLPRGVQGVEGTREAWRKIYRCGSRGVPRDGLSVQIDNSSQGAGGGQEDVIMELETKYELVLNEASGARQIAALDPAASPFKLVVDPVMRQRLRRALFDLIDHHDGSLAN